MATFTVAVPEDTKPGTYAGVASIRLKGARIATVNFVLEVALVRTNEPPTALPGNVRLYKSAFASYATEDRDEVIAHVLGMRKTFRGFKVFIDVVDIRAGELWEQELRKRIAETDVFYLFWCRHAKASEWVEKEWRCALESRGIEYIDPVPLESVDAAAPPPELAVKHFNDPLLPYKKGHHA